MSSSTSGLNPQNYLGVNASTPPNLYTIGRPPTIKDWQNFILGDFWLDYTTQKLYVLTSIASHVANWAVIAAPAGDIDALIPDVGGAVFPFAGNINVFGAATPDNPNINITTTNVAANTFGVGLKGGIQLPSTNTGGLVGYISLGGSNSFHAYGANNIFVGALAGNTAVTLTGARNCGYGVVSLFGLTSGNDNTAIGYDSLNAITSASNNTAVGSGALNAATTGHDNIAIGYNTGMNYGTESNNILIGNNGVALDAGVIRIGRHGAQTECFIAGIDNVNVGSVVRVVTETIDQLGTADIEGGTNITITASPNVIQINGNNGSVNWIPKTMNTTIIAGNGYIANGAGTLQFLLPASGSVGDTFRITGINNATGWQITQNANQQIFISTSNTMLGVGGSITSSATRDSIECVCVVAGASTVWQAVSFVGNLTIV